MYKTFGTSRAVRHPQADYAADLDIHVVVAARAGRPFENTELACQVCRSVEVVCKQLGYRLYGYCLMPEHLHVLLSPGTSGVELKTGCRGSRASPGTGRSVTRGSRDYGSDPAMITFAVKAKRPSGCSRTSWTTL
ncbi:MAG: transposase [Phycisphaerales bacterium]|nr:MAG: transposase [Phycisphaerales bacterium]